MHPDRLKDILQRLSSKKITVSQAEKELANFSYEDIGFARIDHHRQLRRGFPEVIYCPGKTDRQIEEIAARIKATGCDVLATRLTDKTARSLKRKYKKALFVPKAGLVYIAGGRRTKPKIDPKAIVAICSAGTSDIPVAEEAAVTAWAAGCSVSRIYDIGVAGLHRLAPNLEPLRKARAVVVVAGMEGALASVVSGMIDRPVIAVPTSIGYGASFGGIAALLGMLNSCSPGVVVVNIDNGFGAGMAAAMIARDVR